MSELFYDMPGTEITKSAKTKAAHGAALVGTSVAGGVIANQLPQNAKGQKQWKKLTPVSKAFLKPMAPMKPQVVAKPKTMKIQKPKPPLKPAKPNGQLPRPRG